MKKLSWVIVLFAGISRIAAGSVTTNGTEVVVDVTTGTQTLTDVYGASVTQLTKTGAGVLEYFPATPSTFGRLVVEKGQLRVRATHALGAGEVQLADYASLMVPTADLTITNKVVFGVDSMAAAFGSDAARLTLTSVGSTRAVGNRTILLGRTGGGYSKARLSLTDAASEALDCITIQGKTDVELDGGTIRLAPEAKKTVFVDKDAVAYDKTYTVGPAGVTVEVPAGVDIALGMAPYFASAIVTNVLQTYAPSNNSFENGKDPWTVSPSPNSYNEYSSVQENGAAFDTALSGGVTYAYTTENGSHYMMLRRGASLSRTVDLPCPGLWRLTYTCGSRPIGEFSLNLSTEVYVDGTCIHTEPALTTHPEKHTFRRVETPAVVLSAGTHTLELRHNDSGISAGSQNYDYFVFERVEIGPRSEGITKTGAGHLALGDIRLDGALDVRAGTVSLDGGILAGELASVTVGADAQLGLSAATVEGSARVAVAAGGTLRFGAIGESLVQNGSFEKDVTGTFTAGAPQGWTRSRLKEAAYNTAGAGYQCNGCALTANGPTTATGNQTAYLRNETALSQTLKDVPAGTYRLSFLYALRQGYAGDAITTAAKINGVTRLTAQASAQDGTAFVRHTAEVTLADGDYVLSLEATGDTSETGAIVFVDDVRLEPLLATADWNAGELHMESGATLQLDNHTRFRIERFFVDGLRVSGGRAAAEEAGVRISGSGSIRFGGRTGLTMIIR